MTKKTIELLAPAGSPDAYRAAVAAGADAVYLGAKGFNARHQADNFEDADLESVIEDAHIKGIKVYFVLNTLLKDSETEEACNLASFVYNKGIDAIIVQDLGLAGVLKRLAPSLPLHASTQMSIHNLDGVIAAKELGIERVILSRELSLNEIQSIVLNSGMEIEVFVHGALCVSRSGQCLLSSYIGGRSGNRGRCAQPCRLPWKTDGKSNFGGYLLSPKDLMTLEILPELINTGISALKIEGRMKSPEYVAAVVSVYRKYLDMAIQNTHENAHRYAINNNEAKISSHSISIAGAHRRQESGTKHSSAPKSSALLKQSDISESNLYSEGNLNNEDNLNNEGNLNSEDNLNNESNLYNDFKVDPEDIRTLMQVFNRGGFTTGYFKDYSFKSLMSTEHPKHWGVLAGTTLSQEGIHQPKYGGDEEARLIRVKLSEKIGMGDGLEIWDPKNNNPSTILSVMLKDGRHVKTATPGDTILVGNFKSEVTPQSMVYKTYGKVLMESLSAITKSSIQRIPIKGEFSVFPDEYPVLDIVDSDGSSVRIVGNEKAQEAKDRPVTSQRIEEQLKKTKDTPYFFESVLVKTNNAFIPVSEINSMRRKALEELTEIRRSSVKRTGKFIAPATNFPGNTQNVSKKKELSLFFYKVPDKLNWEALDIGRIYLSVNDLEQLEAVKKYKSEAYIWIPAILHDRQMDWVINKIKPVIDLADGILVGNLGSLNRIKTEFPEMPVALDFQMNVLNSWTADALKTYSPTSIALSLEMNINEIQQLKSPGIPLEAYVYGEIPVMTMEYCPGSGMGECTKKCRTCRNSEGYITDRKGKRFLYKTDPVFQRTTLYNSSKLMLEDVNPLKKSNVGILRIGVMDESYEEIREICSFYKEQWIGDNEKPVNYTADKMRSAEGRSFTRGHFYRG